MSEHERLTPEEKAQTTANLKLAGQFIRELIDHPERHTALPDKATIVLLPGDDAPDPALSWGNMKMAKGLADQGQHVVTWPVGTPALSGPQILPRWPKVRPENVHITYDRDHDMLTISFGETDKPTMPARMNPHITTLIDAETRIVVSMTVSHFLTEAVYKAPSLTVFLMHPSTQLIGINEADVHAFLVKFAHDMLDSDQEDVILSQIVEELSA